MAISIEEIIDILLETVDEAKNVPLMPSQCMLDRDHVLDMLEELRQKLPVELAQATELVSKRQEYIASAKREAETITARAEQEARRMTEEDTVLLHSRKVAADLVRTAEEDSLALRRSANEYCEDALRRTEEAVTEACEEIKKSRARFSAAASGADISNIK